MSDSLKSQAERIVSVINQELSQADAATENDANRRATALFNRLMGSISDVDLQAAANRVAELKAAHPDATVDELVRRLIKQKTQRTATIGAATSGAGLVPGIGTATALIVGTAADISATFKLQAELVLEIAHVHEYPLAEDEKRRLVLLITGLSAGARSLAQKAGQRASVKIGEAFAEKAVLKALPVVGIIASAGTNALATYIIGQRADAYFRLGEAGLQSWQDSLRAISGVDERDIARWLAAQKDAAGTMVGEAGAAVGEQVRRTTEAIAATSVKAAQTQMRWTQKFWRSVFRGIKRIAGIFLSPFKMMQRFHTSTRKD